MNLQTMLKLAPQMVFRPSWLFDFLRDAGALSAQ